MSKQWRVSWDMWPFLWPAPHRAEKVHDDEQEARSQIVGLKSMEADHEPRQCDEHVWNIRLEERDTGEWAPSPEGGRG